MQRARIISLIVLAVYFIFQLWPRNTAEPTPTMPDRAKAPTQAAEPCNGHIVSAAAGAGEVRVLVEGAAEYITVAWDGGQKIAPTPEVCSAGQCVIKLPPRQTPRMVQMDGCPAQSLP